MRSRLTGIVSVAAVMALAAACNRGPEPDPKDRVANDLKQAHINDVNVDYDRDARVVHLKGAVDSGVEKARAENIAQKAVGTSGTIANELTVKGVDDRTADDMDGAIRNELNAKVDNDRALEGRHVNFDVNNAVVTIKGEVHTQAEKDAVTQMARSTANVKEVVNSLEVNPKIGESTTTPDHAKGRKAPVRH